MLNVFANELYRTGKARISADDCFAALKGTYERCKGSWACTALLAGFGIIAFRDSYGIRPLCMGSRKSEAHEGKDYMLASESVALNFFGSRSADIVDILPGQAVIVSTLIFLLARSYAICIVYILDFIFSFDLKLSLTSSKIEKGKEPVFHQIQPPRAYAPDIFEYVYFARPDSVIDGISVYASRRNMGFNLAKTIRAQLTAAELSEIDAVIPIPETANVSARCVAQDLQKELVDGFVKNRYVFRTFIMPTQKVRRTGIRRKLNAIASEFDGRNVLLVDDSVVRGNTSKEIISMAREAGAKKVIFATCAPPITHVHIYGIDLASSREMVAFRKSNTEIAAAIGADRIIYQSLPDLQDACAKASPRKDQQFEVGVFCGKYVTPVEDGYLEHLESVRNGVEKIENQQQSCQTASENLQDLSRSIKPVANQETGVSTERIREETVNNLQDLGLYNLNRTDGQ